MHPVNPRSSRVQLNAATVSLLRSIVQAGIVVNVAELVPYLVATDEQLARIANVKKREFMRRGINQHTLEKICKPEPVRASRLANVLKVLQQWETEQDT